MKKKPLIYALLVAVIFCGCTIPAKEKETMYAAKRVDLNWVDENAQKHSEEFTIITVDSCEYLIADHDRSRMITHKGNCMFCEKRNKK